MNRGGAIPIPTWKKMWSIQEKILRSQNRAEVVTTFFRELKKIIPHRSSIYFPIDIPTQTPNQTGAISDNIPDYKERLTRFFEYYYKLDPFFKLYPQPNINKVMTTTDVVEDFDKYRKSEFYVDFLKPQGVFYGMVSQFGFNGRPVGGFSLHRGPEDSEFTERDKAIFTNFAPLVGFMLYSFELKANMSANQEKELTSHPSFRFSPREEEVTMYLTQGLKNNEIADRMFISVSTVKNHLQSMFRKTNTKTARD